MAEREANNPADPWSINYFDPPTPHVTAPSPPRFKFKTPHDLPEIDRLFAAQNDLIRAVNALQEIEDSLEGKEPRGYRTLRINLQNAYRVLNRYLRDFALPGGSIT